MKKQKGCMYKLLISVFIAVNFIALCIFYMQISYKMDQEVSLLNDSLIEKYYRGLLVNSTKCRIPDLDPWNSEITPYYAKEKYISCTNKALLTYVTKNGSRVFLNINKEVLSSYSREPITCCYMNVTRKKMASDPDRYISTSECIEFKRRVEIVEQVIKVSCGSTKEVYSNVHAVIKVTHALRSKLHKVANSTRPMSVLIIGIDSVSRLNFIRTLPKAHAFLTGTGWVEFKGYNKIADNTFPNIMAILTGRNTRSIYRDCNPIELGKLDSCNFLWKDFSNFGYVTAYAEDEAELNTFNYYKKGFRNPPTNYYFRPYIVAAHTLKTKKVDAMIYCSGPESSGERILNLAKDFTTTFKDYPSFGVFWMNSFSHNELNSPTRMDAKVLQFFEGLVKAQILNNTMVMFISDHGKRFGRVRQTRSGWLEERLPFFYFWLPKQFREEFPAERKSVEANSVRLISPYDLYMTLQEVLVYSRLNYTTKPSQGCPNCRSILKEASPERSCEDAAIEPHWCTCRGYHYISRTNDTVIEATNFIVDEINNVLSTHKLARRCAKFRVSRILASSMSATPENSDRSGTFLLIALKTEPEAVFEATVSVQSMSSKHFKSAGDISRLDSYVLNSYCVNDSFLQTLCYCKW